MLALYPTERAVAAECHCRLLRPATATFGQTGRLERSKRNENSHDWQAALSQADRCPVTFWAQTTKPTSGLLPHTLLCVKYDIVRPDVRYRTSTSGVGCRILYRMYDIVYMI